jgi:hypothetical protein
VRAELRVDAGIGRGFVQRACGKARPACIHNYMLWCFL